MFRGVYVSSSYCVWVLDKLLNVLQVAISPWQDLIKGLHSCNSPHLWWLLIFLSRNIYHSALSRHPPLLLHPTATPSPTILNFTPIRSEPTPTLSASVKFIPLPPSGAVQIMGFMFNLGLNLGKVPQDFLWPHIWFIKYFMVMLHHYCKSLFQRTPLSEQEWLFNHDSFSHCASHTWKTVKILKNYLSLIIWF